MPRGRRRRDRSAPRARPVVARAAAMNGPSPSRRIVYSPASSSPSGTSVTSPGSRVTSTVDPPPPASATMPIDTWAGSSPVASSRTAGKSSPSAWSSAGAMPPSVGTTNPGMTCVGAGSAVGPTSSTPAGVSPSMTECSRLAAIAPPVLVTCTTGDTTFGARPASESTRWLPAGTMMPSADGASTRPVSPITRTSTVAATAVGLASSTIPVRPTSVAPPTSQDSATASVHDAAANPESVSG